jgi:hypothetical protein
VAFDDDGDDNNDDDGGDDNGDYDSEEIMIKFSTIKITIKQLHLLFTCICKQQPKWYKWT